MQLTGQRPTPRECESRFEADEIFFSTTDRKGIIRSGNDVFVRVSGYPRNELIGRPHNLIRHPDMPRVVFKLLWEEIQAGRPIAAYVKNMAKDGSYYWVLATVVPCAGGYLSVRIKPATPLFGVVQAVYRDLLAVEQAYEAAHPRQRDGAIEASRARLGEHLAGAGFPTYQAFIRAALLAEVAQRDTRTGAARQLQVAVQAQPSSVQCSASTATEALYSFLQGLVARLDTYVGLTEELRHKAQYTRDLSDDVQLFSLNALIAATRMQREGAALGAVAALIQARSEQSTPLFRELTTGVLETADLLHGMMLPVAIASIQAEALASYVREPQEAEQAAPLVAADVQVLAACLTTAIGDLGTAMRDLDGRLRGLNGQTATLRQSLGVMRALELNGRIEASRVPDAQGVVTLFHTIAEKLGGATHELSELGQASRFSLAAELDGIKRAAAQLDAIRNCASTMAEGAAPDARASTVVRAPARTYLRDVSLAPPPARAGLERAAS
ncbi:MAG: PAS domain-containing protein [Chloroflexi bacterium]|nr:PAS domain-containing protein [Chloroflexota bacterium]